MELPSDEFVFFLQLYRTAKIQLGGLVPNIASLTLMSFTCHNKIVAVTQSTELFICSTPGGGFVLGRRSNGCKF